MDVIYTLIPGMIFFGLVFVGIMFWAIKRGQYDDMEGDGNRILMDDDDPLLPHNQDEEKNESVDRRNWPDAD